MQEKSKSVAEMLEEYKAQLATVRFKIRALQAGGLSARDKKYALLLDMQRSLNDSIRAMSRYGGGVKR